MTEEILLMRDDHTLPWGFRLTGGRDFNGPLTVVRITGQSIAEKRGLRVGDIIVEINNEKTNNLCHNEAQRFIAEGGNFLKLVVLRGSSPIIPPALTPVREMMSTSLISNSEKKTSSSLISTESVYSLYEDDSFELLDQSDDEIAEFHEPTEEEINQMLLENAEVIEERGKNVIGVNFKRFIPKCEFIKDSAVFQVLQEEQVHKELSEKEQLEKTPNKRFSTFLAPPDRPIPKPKSKSESSNENLTKRKNSNESNESNQEVTNDAAENEPEVFTLENTTEPDEDEKNESINTKESQNTHDRVNHEKGNQSEKEYDTDNPEELTETQNKNNQQNIENNKINVSENEFENQLALIKNALNSLKQLPSMIQLQLGELQLQIDQLMQLKENKTQDVKAAEDNAHAVDSEITVDESHDCEALIEKDHEEENAKFIENGDEIRNEDIVDDQEEYEWEKQNDEYKIMNIDSIKSDDSENIQNERTQEEKKDASITEKEEAIQKRRPACPLTPLPRPVVLPGGRIWRKPKDAYNEEFIAETLISQAEVLVGSTVGVNFRKYEPPKFDLSNSAVYKLIHNIESQKTGLTERDTIPSLQDYYQSPISSRHFYCANLAAKSSNSNEDRSSKNGNESGIPSQK